MAQAGSSGESRSAGGSDVSPVRYPQPYDMSAYIRDSSAYFDMPRSSMLPTSGTALTVAFGPGNRDTALDAWR